MNLLRYVILHHGDIPEPHFDLMFETRPGSDLATWRSQSWPIEESTPVTRLRDHRRFFLQYEGVLSEQRGMVQRIAEGECEVEIGEADMITIRITSGTTPVTFRLSKISDNRWQADLE